MVYRYEDFQHVVSMVGTRTGDYRDILELHHPFLDAKLQRMLKISAEICTIEDKHQDSVSRDQRMAGLERHFGAQGRRLYNRLRSGFFHLEYLAHVWNVYKEHGLSKVAKEAFSTSLRREWLHATDAVYVYWEDEIEDLVRKIHHGLALYEHDLVRVFARNGWWIRRAKSALEALAEEEGVVFESLPEYALGASTAQAFVAALPDSRYAPVILNTLESNWRSEQIELPEPE